MTATSMTYKLWEQKDNITRMAVFGISFMKTIRFGKLKQSAE